MDFEGCYASGLVNTEDWGQFSYGLGLGGLTEVAIVHLHHAGVAMTQLLSYEDQGHPAVDEARGVRVAKLVEDHGI